MLDKKLEFPHEYSHVDEETPAFCYILSKINKKILTSIKEGNIIKVENVNAFCKRLQKRPKEVGL